ncbi:P-loop containing nucleoside triphosphate hydrolase protein [Rhizodiscina lignyota]|uniref:P-loop containing nucleoside triphosphate hydrolase protein n=1 Tax=Rhizodiscina lignyota TaxID=1504668 RepID=A0A9P4IPZ9_9PEZI|nr:P-loop containing nucleoside triphosphate hydrolase protein [Rhizodiscina lignyota]
MLIDGNSEFFQEVVDWLSDRVQGRHSLAKRTTTITYELGPGSTVTDWYWKRPFFFTRERDPNPSQLRVKESIIIRTVGWSCTPLKELLEKIGSWSAGRKKYSLSIKRPASKECDGNQGRWYLDRSCAPRRLETVILDEELKRDVIDDVRSYIADAETYARRGIPYRRGYLFYGPPGTGKSSFALALASHFQLEVYTLSLAERSMTDVEIRVLFGRTRKPSMIILEDIDSAGLQREQQGSPDGVTLSGLLNVIDGAGAVEGRVLIMTTNHLENLDPALIRPGRIGRRVELPLATKAQAKRMFMVHYELPKSNPLVDKFENGIPETSLSPASIQNHFIKNMDDPDAAVGSLAELVKENGECGLTSD